MINFIKLKPEEKRIIFENTASKLRMNSAIIEKDFWVCFILDHLFSQSEYKKSLAFKGGTCLSKVYKVIDRFSEDIDLILDWRLLGYKKNEPWEERSNTQQQGFVLDAHEREYTFLKNNFLPSVKSNIEKLLDEDVSIEINDDGVIIFDYPKTIQNDNIMQIIRLEIGALAAWTPVKNVAIHSYIYELYPKLFSNNDINVLATTDERTFWEKATILHAEANRPKDSKIPKRYSRHYYDIYCMHKKGVVERALLEKKLLAKVLDFKNKFYYRKWAKYENGKDGILKLLPPSHSIIDLKKDYEDMKEMIYGDYPSFDVLLDEIKMVEDKINKK